MKLASGWPRDDTSVGQRRRVAFFVLGGSARLKWDEDRGCVFLIAEIQRGMCGFNVRFHQSPKTADRRFTQWEGRFSRTGVGDRDHSVVRKTQSLQ